MCTMTIQLVIPAIFAVDIHCTSGKGRHCFEGFAHCTDPQGHLSRCSSSHFMLEETKAQTSKRQVHKLKCGNRVQGVYSRAALHVRRT